MKSILKIKIIGIDYYTMKRVVINKTIDCNDINFIDKIIPPIKINNGEYTLPETILSAKEQADQYISEQSDLLNDIIHDDKQELNCILNWEVLSIENIDSNDNKTYYGLSTIKHNKSKVSEIEKINFIFSELQKKNNKFFSKEFVNNFYHTYQEMKDVLNGLSLDKKILIVFRSLNVTLMGVTNAYQHMLDLYKNFDDEYDKLMIEDIKNDKNYLIKK